LSAEETSFPRQNKYLALKKERKKIMAKTVVGLMNTTEEAQGVINSLINSGFDRKDVGMMARREGGEREGTGTYAGTETRTRKEADSGGALEGAGTGAAIGGGAGLLVGLAALAIPGIGPIVAAGPIATALTGLGIGAAAGGVIGALANMGVSEEDASYYAEGVRRGGVLVTVRAADEDAERAAEIMRNHGAVDIEERGQHWRKSGWNRFDEKAEPLSSKDISREREGVIPVVEEDVKVGKRQVSKGGVRVYSHVTEHPVEEEVTLREEHAKVDRRPVDRPATPADREAFQERSYEVRETGEEPVVSKQARVKEEVSVGKEATSRTETVKDTARRQDVKVEHLEGKDRDAYASQYVENLSRNRRYEGKEWSQIENDVRSDWEREHPGTWDRYKGSIRSGWERVVAYSGGSRRR
jgi:uncharacterized protein (TIGR02271 family)